MKVIEKCDRELFQQPPTSKRTRPLAAKSAGNGQQALEPLKVQKILKHNKLNCYPYQKGYKCIQHGRFRRNQYGAAEIGDASHNHLNRGCSCSQGRNKTTCIQPFWKFLQIELK